MGTVVLAGATSGSTTLTPVDAVTATITMPSVTGTLATLGANTFVGNQAVTGTLSASGAATLSSTLGVTGTITASDTFINAVGTTALFGVLTSANGSKFVIQSNMSGANAPEIINTHADSTGDYALKFYRNTSSLVGSIQTTNVATSYVTSSDYRLKENVQPMTEALAIVAALKPVSFNWKVDGSDGQGFIAHELAEVVPDCVTGEKDAVNENGSIKPQGIDTSFLVATLTAAIQELAAKVAALEAK
jgi:hypothetical protein